MNSVAVSMASQSYLHVLIYLPFSNSSPIVELLGPGDIDLPRARDPPMEEFASDALFGRLAFPSRSVFVLKGSSDFGRLK